jgi:lipoprotein-anchoring transpeptidase ErfK/SrfK
VVRAAILLDRLKFSPGEISSSYSNNLAKAVAAFQAVSGLPAVGSVDAATWEALNRNQSGGQAPAPVQQSAPRGGNPPNQGTQQPPQPAGPAPQPQGSPPPAVITYVIAMEDVSGKFTDIQKASGPGAGERRMLSEAKLRQLNFQSPLELLAEKFHTSRSLLVHLNPRRGFHKAGEQIQVPNVLTPAPPRPASLVVDASTQSVAALDGKGKVLAFYPATVGSQHDPLPVGNWKIVDVDWYPKFKYNPNLFWDAEEKHPRATLPPGPRSPVGVVWIGLSKSHYGIHGTPAPSEIGKTQSHGCIRLTNWDASELASVVQPGLPVVLEEGIPSAVRAQPPSSP